MFAKEQRIEIRYGEYPYDISLIINSDNNEYYKLL